MTLFVCRVRDVQPFEWEEGVVDKRIGYEERFYVALKRITAYMTTKQLQRESSGRYGLEYTEALEMAYENVIGEAKYALKGYRRRAIADRHELSKDAATPSVAHSARE